MRSGNYFVFAVLAVTTVSAGLTIPGFGTATQKTTGEETGATSTQPRLSLPNIGSIVPNLPNPADIINNVTAIIPSTNWENNLPQEDQLVSENINTIQNKFSDVNDNIKAKLNSIYQNASKTVLEDAILKMPDLVRKYGYPCEEHTVETTDGYILTVHRIPHGKNASSEGKRPVVFLQHGILSSSADWVIPGVDKALAYLLADAGYDVWLGNARGNTYSRKHKTLTPEDGEFWNFCWNNIALFDMPAMIDYALRTAGQDKLYYVGHSQGTTVFYVLCAEKPEYNDKFYAHFSLAPIAYMNHMTSPLLRLVAPTTGIAAILPLIGVNEFLPSSPLMQEAGELLCSDDDVTQVLCANSLFVMAGFNRKQMNETLLPVMMAHTPAGCSTKQILHYGQEVNSGKFQQYDFGLLKNMRQYNSAIPPEYAVEKITAPMYIFYSHNDWLANEVDVARLYERLNEPKQKFLVEDAQFNHIDFLFAMNAREQVYDKLISIINSL